jgi:hypothetical protein
MLCIFDLVFFKQKRAQWVQCMCVCLWKREGWPWGNVHQIFIRTHLHPPSSRPLLSPWAYSFEHYITRNGRFKPMKQISEMEKKPFTSSLNICPWTRSLVGISEQSMGAKNRVGIGLSYRPARLHRLAESIPPLLYTEVERLPPPL